MNGDLLISLTAGDTLRFNFNDALPHDVASAGQSCGCLPTQTHGFFLAQTHPDARLLSRPNAPRPPSKPSRQARWLTRAGATLCPLKVGGTCDVPFRTVGTFRLTCSVHPNMVASVTGALTSCVALFWSHG
jgi:plastocyanin